MNIFIQGLEQDNVQGQQNDNVSRFQVILRKSFSDFLRGQEDFLEFFKDFGVEIEKVEDVPNSTDSQRLTIKGVDFWKVAHFIRELSGPIHVERLVVRT